MLLVIDGVQDPGNVGTLLRTAHALGARGTIALRGTADVWGPKTLRAAMGATFRHPVLASTTPASSRGRGAHDVTLWADARPTASRCTARSAPTDGTRGRSP